MHSVVAFLFPRVFFIFFYECNLFFSFLADNLGRV
jgi:hypothetical protein